MSTAYSNSENATGSLSGAFLALVRRDLLLAFRRRTELMFPVIFLLVVISLFPLGIGPGPQLLARIAPGVIWIAALLAAGGLRGPGLVRQCSNRNQDNDGAAGSAG